MKIIVPNLPQMNVKVIEFPPKCTTDDGDISKGISRNTSVSSF